MDPRAILDGCGKSRSHREFFFSQLLVTCTFMFIPCKTLFKNIIYGYKCD